MISELKVQKTIKGFYRTGIPFAYRIFRKREWLKSRDTSFLLFLRRFLAINRIEKTAHQQANVLTMIVEEGWTFEQVKEIPFRYLLKLSYKIRHINQIHSPDLLELAKAAKNIQVYEAGIDGLASNKNTNPKKVKYLLGSNPALTLLNDYDERTSWEGDKRSLAEKLADLILVNDPDIRVSKSIPTNVTILCCHCNKILTRYEYPGLNPDMGHCSGCWRIQKEKMKCLRKERKVIKMVKEQLHQIPCS